MHSARQHVPVALYIENLRAIVLHLRTVAHARHVILITPPPLDEQARLSHVQAQGIHTLQPDRTYELTAAYRDACKDTADLLKVPCFDVHEWFLKTGASRGLYDASWRSLLSDGLHLNEQGNLELYEGLMAVLDQHVLQGKGTEAYPHDLPWHSDFGKANTKQIIHAYRKQLEENCTSSV